MGEQRVGPVQPLIGPFRRGPQLKRFGPEQRITHTFLDVRMDAAVLGKCGQQARAIKRHDTRDPIGEVLHGRVGEAHENFGMVADHVEVEVGDHPDRVIAANAGQDARDGTLGEGPMQVIGPRLWISPQERVVSAGVGRVDNVNVEGLL